MLSAPSAPRPRAWAVVLHALTPSQWQANRGAPAAASIAVPPRPPREEPRQIVEVPPEVATDPMRAERPPPDDARYLAERDQTVERQTVSRYADAARKLLRVPQEHRKARRGSGERGEHKVALPGRTGPKGGGGTEADAAAPLPPQPPDEHPQPDPTAQPEPVRTAASADPGLPPVDSTLPSDGEGGQRIDGRRISGMPLQEYETPEGGPNYDGLGLDEGAETRLHTRRFAPAAYWTDVRARIQDDWHRRALSLLQQYDPREDTYFYKPRTVRIAVTLGANGSVKDVHVVESSRLEFYDAIALAVVKDKQPYPPPPPDAIRSDGNARINMAFTWLPSSRLVR